MITSYWPSKPLANLDIPFCLSMNISIDLLADLSVTGKNYHVIIILGKRKEIEDEINTHMSLTGSLR